MFIFDLLNASPIDGLAICLCLITIWWCVRAVPGRSRSPYILLGVLGIVIALLATRLFDIVIAVLFLGAAVVIEIIHFVRRPEGPQRKMQLGGC
jgi:hypothetical protein